MTSSTFILYIGVHFWESGVCKVNTMDNLELYEIKFTTSGTVIYLCKYPLPFILIQLSTQFIFTLLWIFPKHSVFKSDIKEYSLDKLPLCWKGKSNNLSNMVLGAIKGKEGLFNLTKLRIWKCLKRWLFGREYFWESSSKLAKTLLIYRSLIFPSPKLFHCKKTRSELGEKRWLPNMGLWLKGSISWKHFFNWCRILKVETRTGFIEKLTDWVNCLDVSMDSREVEQEFNSNAHQFKEWSWMRRLILCRLAAQ